MDTTYFNTPIQLLKNLATDPKGAYHNPIEKCLDDIIDYCVFDKSKDYSGTDAEKRREACHYFGIMDISNASYKNGGVLFNNTPKRSPKVGLNKTVFFDFYQNDKTELDKVCLLAHLGMKSIIGRSRYKKATFDYLFSRMNGEVKTMKNLDDLPPVLKQYNTRRKRNKIIKELENSWHLKYYAGGVRGFYASYDMNLINLTTKVELNKHSAKEKKRKLQIAEGKKIAQQMIEDSVHQTYTNMKKVV
jgi:hypothetical protein